MRDEVERQPSAARTPYGESHRPVRRREESERGREDGTRLLLGVAEEAPRPRSALDVHRGELAELSDDGVEVSRHEVQELSRAAEAERRPVELLVRQEAAVFVTAVAVELHAEDGRMRSTGELLDAPEGREQHVRLAPYRTGERVATREGVVHAHVVETTPDGSVRDQREEVVLLEAPAAAEEGKLDHEVDADHRAAQLLDEAGDRLHRPTGCEHIVVDDDAGASSDRVGRDLERVL